MQTVIVVVIVILAVFFIGRRFYQNVMNSKTDGCAGGCGCCTQNQNDSCTEPGNRKDPL